MKKRLIIFAAVLVLAVSAVFASVTGVEAEENKELDLVMVLDQSGSMKTNDPNGMMREAANMLTAMMPAKTSRVGIISFNREQTEVVGLTEVSETEDVEEIADAVDEIEYTGDTDIGNAVADAVEMFDENDDRVHAILVLSDGRNDFGIDKNAEQASDERLYDALVAAQNQNCQIYCLGFGEEMSNTDDTPYQKLAGIATDADKISTETDPANIHEFFVDMLADLTGGKPNLITNGEILVEPNVKEANIYLSSPEDFSEVSIDLKDPDGNAIALENNDSLRCYRSGYSAVIKLFNPDPGTYKIAVSAANVEISVGYLPAYEYVLSSSIVDTAGNEISQIDNQATAQIKTVIRQDGQDITDKEVYDGTTATATVTAQDTGEAQNVDLTYQEDGYLQGAVTFDHVAMYKVDITVAADSYDLKDSLEIQANQRGITLAGQLDKKEIDKTFKKSADLIVSTEELMGVIDDPDQVGVEIIQAVSGDADKVSTAITEDGVLLTGLKWGTTKVDITYKDGLGNTVQSSFAVKVVDHFLVALFAALPILIALAVILIIYLVMRQSRMIKGEFEISKVTITKGEDDISVISVRKSYRSKTFLTRKKTLGCGITKYAQDVYSVDNSMPQHKELYQMFANNKSEMKQNLDAVKFVGTYLGLRGCVLKIKKGAAVSMSNNRNYGKAVKLAWRTKSPFKVYTKDSSGTELCIEGTYTNSGRNRKRTTKRGANPNSNTQGNGGNTNNDFGDDFFD